MLPNDPRAEIVDKTRRVADLLDASLPEVVSTDFPHPFETVAPLLLKRVAGLGRSVATLLAAGHEVDARMLMRSALEHMTLTAWLSIDLSDLPESVASARTWKATSRAANTSWWLAHQFRHDQRRAEQQQQLTGAVLTDEVRAAIRNGKQILKEPLALGEFPSVETQAGEVDAAYGGRLSGWPRVTGRQPEAMFTVRGMYVTLHKTASAASTHPGLNALLETFVEASPDNPTSGRLIVERAEEKVDPFGSITAYVLLYATSVAQHIYGGNLHDQALRALGRFDAVRGPGLMLDHVAELLDGKDGRRVGVTGGIPISVEIDDDRTTVVLAEAGGWARIVHQPGPVWTLDGEHQEPIELGPGDFDEVVSECFGVARERVEAADWANPPAWPAHVP